MSVKNIFKLTLTVILNCVSVTAIFLFRQFSVIGGDTQGELRFSALDIFTDKSTDYTVIKILAVLSIASALISVLLFVFKLQKAGCVSNFFVALCEILMLFLMIFGAAGHSARAFTFANSNAFLPMLLSMLSSLVPLMWCCGKKN